MGEKLIQLLPGVEYDGRVMRRTTVDLTGQEPTESVDLLLPKNGQLAVDKNGQQVYVELHHAPVSGDTISEG